MGLEAERLARRIGDLRSSLARFDRGAL